MGTAFPRVPPQNHPWIISILPVKNNVQLHLFHYNFHYAYTFAVGYDYVRPINTCHYDLMETCVCAEKRAPVYQHLEGEMPKTISFGRNVQGANVQRAKRPSVWGKSSRRRILYGAKRPGGETSRQRAKRLGAKRRGGETSSYHIISIRKE